MISTLPERYIEARKLTKNFIQGKDSLRTLIVKKRKYSHTIESGKE